MTDQPHLIDLCKLCNGTKQLPGLTFGGEAIACPCDDPSSLR